MSASFTHFDHERSYVQSLPTMCPSPALQSKPSSLNVAVKVLAVVAAFALGVHVFAYLLCLE